MSRRQHLAQEPFGVGTTAGTGRKSTHKFSPFEPMGKIGSGGMGVVYRARYVPNDRIVALKVVPLDATNAQRLVRFRRETEILKHPIPKPLPSEGMSLFHRTQAASLVHHPVGYP